MSKKSAETAPGIEDRYDEIRQLVGVGRERGFLAYEEVLEALPEEVTSSPEAIEEVFSLFETSGIELMDADTKEQLVRPGAPPRAKEKTEAKDGAANLLEKTNDPVRMYLREMGTVPLLNRQGRGLDRAGSIECGERSASIDALSRSELGHGKRSGQLGRADQARARCRPACSKTPESDVEDDTPKAKLTRSRQRHQSDLED